MLINTLLMSLREIRRNLLRSGLTVLGIIIGVAAVIIIVTLGAGTTRQVQDEISKMGSNMLVLSPGAGNRMGGQSVTSPPFDLFDLAAIRREVEGLGGATPVNMRPTQVVVGNENRRINIMGSDSDFSSVRNWKVVEGRLFTASEVRSGKASCIVGSSVKRDMFNNQSPIGATLRIGKVNCVVIGSLESKGPGDVRRRPGRNHRCADPLVPAPAVGQHPGGQRLPFGAHARRDRPGQDRGRKADAGTPADRGRRAVRL